MLAIPGLRAFSISAGRNAGCVSCNADGVRVGDVPLLEKQMGTGSATGWTVRATDEVNDELTALYRLPVDIAAKTNALALIAKALNRGDVAMAAIATVQMQFPNPPPLGKGAESPNEILRRAIELRRSGLLKVWDPAEHPRTGTKPNRGWFALKPKAPRTDSRSMRWPQPNVNKFARRLARTASEFFAEDEFGLLRGVVLDILIRLLIESITPVELNQGEDLLTAQLRASLQPPKTLEELQQRPTDDIEGYEQHHIVEQNPDNIRKVAIIKFGSELINDQSNSVWVPHFPHIEVTAEYNSVPDDEEGNDDRTILRVKVNKLDFEAQREIGLRLLRKYRVLK